MAHKTLIDGKEYKVSGGRTLVDGKGYDIRKGRTLVNGKGYDIPFAITLNITQLSSTELQDYGVIVEGVEYTDVGSYEVDASVPFTLFFNEQNTGITHVDVWLNGTKLENRIATKTDFKLVDGFYYYDFAPTTSIVNIKFSVGGFTTFDIYITTED